MGSPLAQNSAIAGAAATVDTEPIGAADVVAGTPEAGAVALGELGDVEVGIWEMTAGTCRDIEADEFFVVLAGRATVQFADGSKLELGPGDVARLAAGAATEWTVHETLRKVYITASPDS